MTTNQKKTDEGAPEKKERQEVEASAGGDDPKPASDSGDDDAQRCYEKWRKVDPFPQIEPALLNSAHIEGYVVKTGMLYPFDAEELKPASYPLRLRGKCVRWEDNGKKKIVVDLKPGDDYLIPRNSIAFVTLEPMIRLPAYIAARFNLKIDFVYKGLLLGTGPLVDPGWTGQLSIPLHNLTDQEYWLRGGDQLIWMEFTKTSAITDEGYRSRGELQLPLGASYHAYPPTDPADDVMRRIERALGPGRKHVMSSLSQTFDDVREKADSAEESAKGSESSARKAENRSWIGSILAAAVAAAGLVGILGFAYAIKTDAAQALTRERELASEQRKTLQRDVEQLKAREKKLAEEIDNRASLMMRLEDLEHDLKSLQELMSKADQGKGSSNSSKKE